jgi:hypothetical protein
MFSPFRADIGIGVMDSKAEVLGDLQIARDDLVEAGAAVVDEIHLVDGHHDVADAQHVGDVGVALALRQHAFAGIDQDNREIGGRGAGRHVAGILFVARAYRRR